MGTILEDSCHCIQLEGGRKEAFVLAVPSAWNTSLPDSLVSYLLKVHLLGRLLLKSQTNVFSLILYITPSCCIFFTALLLSENICSLPSIHSDVNFSLLSYSLFYCPVLSTQYWEATKRSAINIYLMNEETKV